MFGNRLVNYGGAGGIRRGLIWQSGQKEGYKEYYVIPIVPGMKPYPYLAIKSVMFTEQENPDSNYIWTNINSGDLNRYYYLLDDYTPVREESPVTGIRIASPHGSSPPWVPDIATTADSLLFVDKFTNTLPTATHSIWVYNYKNYVWSEAFPYLIIPTQRVPEVGYGPNMSLFWYGSDWHGIQFQAFQDVVNDDYTSKDGAGVFTNTYSHIYPGRGTSYFKSGRLLLYGRGSGILTWNGEYSHITWDKPYNHSDVAVRVFKDATLEAQWIPGYDCVIKLQNVLVDEASLSGLTPVPVQ